MGEDEKGGQNSVQALMMPENSSIGAYHEDS